MAIHIGLAGATGSAMGPIAAAGGHVWVLGYPNKILHSSDGGESWSVLSTHTPWMRALWASPAGVGLVGHEARIKWLALEEP